MSIKEKVLIYLLNKTELGRNITNILHDSWLCARKLRVEYMLIEHKINSIEPKIEYEGLMERRDDIGKIIRSIKPE